MLTQYTLIGTLGALICPCLAAELSVPKAIPITTATAIPEIEAVIISAPKLSQDLLTAPLSATVSQRDFLESAMVRSVKEAAIYAPNTFFTEFSARKLSNPNFRGIGASPLNPGVTTYIDGVPQLNSNSSSISLLDVDQIDFVRGPQGALYGRNTVGGLINITSTRPSLTTFGGDFQTTFGNYNLYDFRGRVTGPLIQDQLGFSLSGGTSERDGFTKNTLTGQDIDNRSAQFGKAQFLWTPNERLEVRLIIAGETARDGDYALGDLGSLRMRPREVQRDYIGFTSRDVLMPTLQVTYHADHFDFTSVTGYVSWTTKDSTELDYTPLPLVRRFNREQMRTWTQEFRFSNPVGEPVSMSDDFKLSWQAGMFLFHASYEQTTANDFTPIPLPLPISSQANFTDMGLGTYAQGTITFRDKLSLSAGLRWDYETKAADTRTTWPLFSGRLNHDTEFHQLTPQAAIRYQFNPTLMSYFSFSGGYKAGGFNALGPVIYDQERSWNYEFGVKGRGLHNKLGFGIAAFYTDWKNMQLNQFSGPSPTYIQNVGNTQTHGLEMNLDYKLHRWISVFSSASWQDTSFLQGAVDSGANISGNRLPYAPKYNFTLGALLSVPLDNGLSLYARADIQTVGSFNYSAQNTAAQDAYTLANFRLGVKQNGWFAEAYVNNAFNTEYIPIALPYESASGFIGENAAPLTMGIRMGIRF